MNFEIHKNTIYRSLLLLTMFSGMSAGMLAQTPIKKEVEVVKPYQPVISDAYKLNVLPKINDSIIIKPSFEYGITSTKVETGFEVTPIGAAKIGPLSLPKLYKTYFKLGLGNYSTTYGEIFINTLRSRKGTGGIHFNHYSSTGKVKLDNGKKVFAGFSDNDASIYGKRFLDKAELFGEVNFNSKTAHHYGYRPSLDTSVEKGAIRQNFIHFNTKGGIQSTHTDSSKLLYMGLIDYHYTQDKFSHKEHQVNLAGSFSKQFNTHFIGTNVSLDIFNRSNNLDPYSNALFTLNPYLLLSTDEYKLNAGLNIHFANEEDGNYVKLYPKVDFQFNVVKDVIVPFIGVSGEVKNHSYQSIAWENPFIRPDLVVRNTDSKLNLYGGVKGNLGSKSSYIVKAGVYTAHNFYFYVNDSSRMWNQFSVVYDEADLFNLSGELTYDATESLSFGAKANFNNYNLTKELYAWHRPKFDLTFNTRYNLRNKIIASLETYYMGKRYARPYLRTDPAIELKGAFDLNLLLEYRYTKILSGYIQFRNMAASQYEYWNQYPSQRFSVMIGMTYAL
ncbi:MAG TPA: hypothetical protein VHO90_18655 [Bacteroidales bacterium]|nr:hypothetical protein [Bacteroidales bacterium]